MATSRREALREVTADPLRRLVWEAMVQDRLVQPGDCVLVGVSGGPDSVALLHALVRLQDLLGIRTHVVHVDHQLRTESRDDAVFVQELSNQLKVSANVERRHVLQEAERLGLSLEDAARRARYDALLGVARRIGAQSIAVAHTADDQAETVLMRLLRGAGLAGLSAMPVVRPLQELRLIRPLLQAPRTEVLDYLRREGVPFRQDASNQDLRFVRNRIRHQLLPLLEDAFNPNIKQLMNQFAQQCRADADYLREAAQRQWKRLVKRDNGQAVIRLAPLRRQPRAIQAQLIRLVLEHLQGDLARFEYRHWLEIEDLIQARPVGTIVDLPGSIQVSRSAESLTVRVESRREDRTASGPTTRSLTTVLSAGQAPREAWLRDRRRHAEPLDTLRTRSGARRGIEGRLDAVSNAWSKDDYVATS